MPSITNAGGSVTSAAVLMLLAWGLRWLRTELNRGKPEQEAPDPALKNLGRFYAKLSPASLRLLVRPEPAATAPLPACGRALGGRAGGRGILPASGATSTIAARATAGRDRSLHARHLRRAR